MAVRKILYVVGLIIAGIATVMLFYGTIFLTSNSILGLAGIALVGYYLLFGTLGSIFVIAGKVPASPVRAIPIVLAVVQLICIIAILSTSKKADSILMMFPAALLLIGGLKR